MPSPRGCVTFSQERNGYEEEFQTDEGCDQREPS